MRMSMPTIGDHNKLKCLLEYVHRSMDLVQIISASKIEVLQTWVDASYAVHTDIRSPTSGVMLLGHGVIHH